MRTSSLHTGWAGLSGRRERTKDQVSVEMRCERFGLCMRVECVALEAVNIILQCAWFTHTLGCCVWSHLVEAEVVFGPVSKVGDQMQNKWRSDGEERKSREAARLYAFVPLLRV